MRSAFQLLDWVMTAVESEMRRRADRGIARRLGAAIGVHRLVQIAVAGEDAEAGIGDLGEIAAAVDGDVAEIAAVQAAVGARIGRDDRRGEVLVLEAAAQERADAGDALDEIVALVDLAVDLAGARRSARYRSGAKPWWCRRCRRGPCRSCPCRTRSGRRTRRCRRRRASPRRCRRRRPARRRGWRTEPSPERAHAPGVGHHKIEHVAGSPPEQSSRNATRLG